MVEGEAGGVEGEDEFGFGRGLEIVLFGRVIALHEDAAAEVAAGGGEVDPAYGVLDVFALVGEVEELVDAVELDAFVVDFAGDDGLEAQGGPGDEAGEAEASDGCAEESAFWVGVQRRCVPSVRMSSNWVMWQPKVPAMWWFLPWMSLAIAPPRVTYFVPGVTGRKKPRGTAKSRIWARVIPASAVRRPVSGSKLMMRSMPVVTAGCRP